MDSNSENGDEKTFICFVNGVKIVDDNVDPEMTLIQYLRIKLKLIGTKLGCSEGGCGACTVMISKYDSITDTISHFSVNACLYPICAAHGQAVTTVEGIGSTKKLHPIQEVMAKSHGSQCGFCTPGFVMSMYALLRTNSHPTPEQVERAFEGNLCRCTGYRPILEGMKEFARPQACALGVQCCRTRPSSEHNGVCNGNAANESEMGNGWSEYVAPDPTQELLFPSELKVHHVKFARNLRFEGPRVTWLRPNTLSQLLRWKAEYPQARLVNGNTEVGVETKFKNQVYPVLISPALVPELVEIVRTNKGVEVGAAVTLTELNDVMREAVDDFPADQTRVYAAVIEMLRWFAGHQIRNVSAIAGNIITASPISDLNPIFMAAGCRLKLANANSTRYVTIDENFFPGYRKTLLKPDEIVVSISICHTLTNEYFYGYKQAHRREDDIAIVNAGMRVVFKPGSDLVESLALCYGGMAPTTVKACATSKIAVNRSWDEDLLCDVCSSLETDLPLDDLAPGGSVQYRRTLTTSFFYKFYMSVQKHLYETGVKTIGIPDDCLSATTYYQHRHSEGCQVFGAATDRTWSVGQPMVHAAAAKHVTGEAIYTDDIKALEGEAHLALVTSTRAHARIISVDTSNALAVAGVIDYVSHRDVQGQNCMGCTSTDEEIFASKEVHCIGQIIGAVLADSQVIAQRAAKLVAVTYEDLPAVITIEEAIGAESYLVHPLTIENGDLTAGFADADVVITGQQRLRGQEHFYLETNAAIAIPSNEDSGMEMFVSSQCPTTVQLSVARTLGCAANKIVSRVKRLGGGFGGKETRFCVVAQPAAVAAHKLKRPVRCVLDRDEDMAITGTRHPFLGKYKIGAKNDGRIVAVDCEIYSNGGCSKDLSQAVMERAMFHITNAYKFPNLRVTGRVCRTNLPSNTAFRGFGAPQAMFICETFMDHVATRLSLPAHKVREVNLFSEGDTTHYNSKLDGVTVKKCWFDCRKQSDYDHRLKEVDEFNSENKWKKRGVALIPTQFGIAFSYTPLNQSGALLHVYKDGSVLLAHGGTEMGQGLHTKMLQVASQALQVPIEKIYLNETCTNTVPNTSPTAASCGSDLNGMAVLEACEKIMSCIQPIKAANPNSTWEQWIMMAYLERISLSAAGFYRTPGIGYNFATNSGRPFSYFTVGAACSEVEIDCLTGDHKVLRTDIVMDIGNSLNPAIDIGQIEGAFIQGYGLFMLEELRHSPSGYLYTRGPGMYKIPSAGDVPAQFNVTILKNVPNPSAIYSSKAIGEPPLFLAASVYHATKAAIRAARRQNNATVNFSLVSPASAENIRLACGDRFVEQFTRGGTAVKAWDVLV